LSFVITERSQVRKDAAAQMIRQRINAVMGDESRPRGRVHRGTTPLLCDSWITR
jgi:hypothetical protein